MIVQRFVRWCETAGSSRRAEDAALLARLYVEGGVPFAEREESLATLVLLLDDESPKVRRAMAEVLATSPAAPRTIVAGLAHDTEEIALLVLHSPVLRERDLLALCEDGTPAMRLSLAARPELPASACGVLADLGEAEACAALLANASAGVTLAHLALIAERHGEDARLRGALIDRADLPAEVRQTLLLEAARAVAGCGLVQALLPEARLQRVVFDSCERATADIAETVQPADMGHFVEHLRASGQISTAFLVRMVCCGNIDLFAASLTALSGRSAKRVRAVIVDGREGPFGALMADCGLPPAAAPLLRIAIRIWKQAVAGRIGSEAEDLPALVMQHLAESFRALDDAAPGHRAAAALLDRLEAETMREGARFRALRLAAA